VLRGFPLTSAVSGWWSIGTWSNGPHPSWTRTTTDYCNHKYF